MGKALIAAMVTALWATTPAQSQMTVCDHEKCEITESGKTRSMTPKEINLHYRKNSHGSLAQLRCKFSDDAEACERHAKELRRLFAY
jgi:hypothetical protein